MQKKYTNMTICVFFYLIMQMLKNIVFLTQP